jgi:SNF2 family DNA or RNA helicase
VFLISLKAGGVGLNLTEADYVFIIDPWWNPAAENQAISRSHRIGQENKVFAYRFITTESIEERIMDLQRQKSELADIFVNSNNPLSKISEDILLQLF